MPGKFSVEKNIEQYLCHYRNQQAEVLREFADEINYNLELDPDTVKKTLENGLVENDAERGEIYKIKPIFIANDPVYSPIPPWDHSKYYFY